MECIDHGRAGDKNGYAKTRYPELFGRKTLRLHRVVFFKEHGYWPEVVMHTCDNPRCINPEHLVAGTFATNAHDRDSKGRANHYTADKKRKLTDEQADVVRHTPYTCAHVARMFGIHYMTAKAIRSGKTYQHRT